MSYFYIFSTKCHFYKQSCGDYFGTFFKLFCASFLPRVSTSKNPYRPSWNSTISLRPPIARCSNQKRPKRQQKKNPAANKPTARTYTVVLPTITTDTYTEYSSYLSFTDRYYDWFNANNKNDLQC